MTQTEHRHREARRLRVSLKYLFKNRTAFQPMTEDIAWRHLGFENGEIY